MGGFLCCPCCSARLWEEGWIWILAAAVSLRSLETSSGPLTELVVPSSKLHVHLSGKVL